MDPGAEKLDLRFPTASAWAHPHLLGELAFLSGVSSPTPE